MSFSPRPRPTPLMRAGSERRGSPNRTKKSPRFDIKSKTEEKIRKIEIPEETNEIEIKIPEPPKTAPASSPRAKRPLTEKELFFKDINKFLADQFTVETSDSDKIHVYKKCFDFLCTEFALCRPLLERIKKEYDTVAKELLERKREIVIDSELSFAAEDSYSNIVTEMRNVKNKEFKVMKEEADKKLDIMTELRLHRSSLLKTIEQLENKRIELKEKLKNERDMIGDIIIKNNNLKQEARVSKMEAENHIKTLNDLLGDLDKASIGAEQLQESKDKLVVDLKDLNEKKKNLIEEISLLKKEQEENSNRLKEDIRTIDNLEKERANNTEKLRSVTERNAQNETKMREMLKEIEIENEEALLENLFKQLLDKSRLKAKPTMSQTSIHVSQKELPASNDSRGQSK